MASTTELDIDAQYSQERLRATQAAREGAGAFWPASAAINAARRLAEGRRRSRSRSCARPLYPACSGDRVGIDSALDREPAVGLTERQKDKVKPATRGK
jgi:hypothetical protein